MRGAPWQRRCASATNIDLFAIVKQIVDAGG
jgi:hypothetical protein